MSENNYYQNNYGYMFEFQENSLENDIDQEEVISSLIENQRNSIQPLVGFIRSDILVNIGYSQKKRLILTLLQYLRHDLYY